MERVGNFSKDQVNEIFMRWYQGEKVCDLLKELSLQRIPGLSFGHHFPPMTCEVICPYCKEEMHAFRSDSAYYKKSGVLYDVSKAFCLICKHDLGQLICKCEGCELKRKEEKLILDKEKAEKLSQRAVHLERLYNNIVSINFETDNLINLIYLFTLCYQSTCEDVTLISPPSTAKSPLTPCDSWDEDLIKSSLNYIAPFCDDERLLQITDEGRASWYGQRVFYRIKIGDTLATDFSESLLRHIKQRINNLSLDEKFEFISFLERLMISECMAYLEYMRNDFKLPHQAGPKTIGLFKKLIRTLRIDQIYTVIWIACKEAVAYQTQNGLPKAHASNLVLGKIDTYVDKASQNGWKIKSYYRDTKNFKIRQSAVSCVIFNKILNLDSVGIDFSFKDILVKLGLVDQTQPENIEFSLPLDEDYS